MPIGPLHQSRKKKNLAVLGLIVGWIILVWVVTVLKIEKVSQEGPPATTAAPEVSPSTNTNTDYPKE